MVIRSFLDSEFCSSSVVIGESQALAGDLYGKLSACVITVYTVRYATDWCLLHQQLPHYSHAA